MKLFFSHLNATFRGAVIGQIVPIAAMPIISRLYAPDEYGIFASLLSLSIVLTALMMLQMEVAVVLPQDDETGSKVARTAFQTGIVIASTLFILMIGLQPLIKDAPGLSDLYGWSVLAPILGFLMVMVLLGNYLGSRLRLYHEVGNSTAALQIVNCATAIGLGLIKPGVGSLLWARIMGQAASVAVCIKAIGWLGSEYKKHGILPWGEMKAMLSRYRKFPLFTLPNTVLSMSSRECVTIILIAFQQPVAAGFYALVRSVLMIPASLLSTSVGPIFYREAAQSIDRPEFKIFSYELMLAIACVMAPGCIYIANWGPQIFAFIFGQSWAQAGIYAFVFMPVSILFVLSVWCSKVFEIRNRQNIAFRIQLVFDTLSIGTMIALLSITANPILSIGGYVAVQCVYLLVYLGFVFRLLNLSVAQYVWLLSAAVFAAGIQEIIHSTTGLIQDGTWIHLFIETAVMGAVTLATALFFWRLLKRSPVMNLA